MSFNNNASFNVHELDAASNNSVEDIRNLVEQVRYAPQTGKYKIYIIDEVHMLSNSAFNAFLKTLEEPPSYAIFILATTERHKIIPTILSRCQIFDFNRIRIEDMVKQTRVCMELIRDVLKSYGAKMDDIVKVNTFYKGGASYDQLHKNLSIRSASFKDPGPTTTGIPLEALGTEGTEIEIEAYAIVD